MRPYERGGPKNTNIVVTAGLAAASMAAATVIAAKSASPSANLVQSAMSVGGIVLAFLPVSFAANRVLDQMGLMGKRAFDALAETKVGQVLGTVRSGTLAGSIVTGIGISELGKMVPWAAFDMANPTVWKYAAIPALTLLGFHTLQRGLDRADKRAKSRVNRGAMFDGVPGDAAPTPETPEVVATQPSRRPAP